MQKQLTGAWAVLLKRGWSEDTTEQRHASLAEVEHTIAASNDAAARCTGMEMLEVRTQTQELLCLSHYAC